MASETGHQLDLVSMTAATSAMEKAWQWQKLVWKDVLTAQELDAWHGKTLPICLVGQSHLHNQTSGLFHEALTLEHGSKKVQN